MATTSKELVRLSEEWKKKYLERAEQEKGGGCQLDEERIGSIVREKVEEAVGPFKKVKKRQQVWDFVKHVLAGALVPVVGPLLVRYLTARSYARKVGSALDVMEHPDAVNKLGICEMICESAFAEAVLQEIFSAAIPFLGPLLAAASLPSRFKEIRQELESMACTLHADWIVHNISPGLLENAQN